MHDDQFSWDDNSCFNDNEQHLKKLADEKKDWRKRNTLMSKRMRGNQEVFDWAYYEFRYILNIQVVVVNAVVVIENEMMDADARTPIIESKTIERTTKP